MSSLDVIHKLRQRLHATAAAKPNQWHTGVAMLRFLALMLLLTLLVRGTAATTLPVVSVTAPYQGVVTQSFTVSGQISPGIGTPLTIPEGLLVEQIFVQPGDQVTEGQTLAVQTVEKVRQISPGVSLRYAQALTGEQVKKAQTYIKSSQNTDGLMVTFWEETQVAVRSPVSTRTCTDVCSIGFCGTAHDAYGASYVVGTAPGSGDTSQCAVSTALAWQLFGSTDILEQALTLDPDTEDARTYRVCGVFVSETEQILYGVETTAAFQLLELTHVSRDNPGQSVQQLLAAAGLAQPDQILYDAALAWVLSALIGIPELLLLLCAGCRLLRLFRNKSLREVIGFGIALLLVCLLPTCLASLPGWMIPNQWGSMAAWHSLLSAAGDRLTEWFALCPTARDVQLKGEAAQVVVFTCGSLVFAVAACLSWGSSVKTKGKRSLCPYDNHATLNL